MRKYLLGFGLALFVSNSFAEDCPACSRGPDKNAEIDFSSTQNILHFEAGCHAQCINGSSPQSKIRFDFHQIPNSIGYNAYPDNYFSIDLNLKSQKACLSEAIKSCEKFGGLNAVKVINVSSGNWNWDQKELPFGCFEDNRKLLSPFSSENGFKLSLTPLKQDQYKADPDAGFLDPPSPSYDKPFNLFPAVPNSSVSLCKIDSKFPKEQSSSICAGCFKDGAMTVLGGSPSTKFGCDFDAMAKQLTPETQKSGALIKQSCLETISLQVKSLAPINKGCPGYAFEPSICDNFVGFVQTKDLREHDEFSEGQSEETSH